MISAVTVLTNDVYMWNEVKMNILHPKPKDNIHIVLLFHIFSWKEEEYQINFTYP